MGVEWLVDLPLPEFEAEGFEASAQLEMRALVLPALLAAEQLVDAVEFREPLGTFGRLFARQGDHIGRANNAGEVQPQQARLVHRLAHPVAQHGFARRGYDKRVALPPDAAFLFLVKQPGRREPRHFAVEGVALAIGIGVPVVPPDGDHQIGKQDEDAGDDQDDEQHGVTPLRSGRGARPNARSRHRSRRSGRHVRSVCPAGWLRARSATRAGSRATARGVRIRPCGRHG